MKNDPRKVCAVIAIAIILGCIGVQAVLMSTSGVDADDYVDAYRQVYTNPLRIFASRTDYVASIKEDEETPTNNPDGNGDNGYTPPPVGEHQHVAWRQKTIPDKINGKTKISKGGCGWCSLTAAMAYLNPEKCANMSPVDWLNVMPASTQSYWNGGQMAWGAPAQWVKDINALGDYGQYELVSTTQGVYQTTRHLQACLDYAESTNTVVLLSADKGMFTSGGHIICCVDVVKDSHDNKYLHIPDSSGVACGNVGKAWEEMANFDWPVVSNNAMITSYKGFAYNLKCNWIIRRVS